MRARASSATLLAVALLVTALNLRAAIASVPPLLDRIESDLGLSAAAAGVLTTLPVICMGVFAPVSQRLAGRIGREATVGWALLAITAGSLVRWGGNAATLYGGTLLAGLGIAIGQTVLPGIVKEHFAERGGVMTGLYTTTMSLGATVAAAVAVPARDGLGGWPISLALWAAPAAIAAVLWWRATAGHRGDFAEAAVEVPHRLPWRNKTAWLISVYLGTQSLIFYSALSWLAPLYQHHGWSAERAGFALSVFNLVGIAGSLSLPAIAARRVDRRPVFWVAVGATAIAIPFIALVPTMLPWLWIVLFGFGQGGAFALGMLLLVDHTHDAAGSARLSGMAFLVAYTMAAAGPVVVGELRDLTGDFRAGFLLLSVAAVVLLVLIAGMTPARRARGV